MDNFFWLTLGVKGSFTFQRLRTVVELATGSHSESDLLLSALVDGFFLSCGVILGQFGALVEH